MNEEVKKLIMDKITRLKEGKKKGTSEIMVKSQYHLLKEQDKIKINRQIGSLSHDIDIRIKELSDLEKEI